MPSSTHATLLSVLFKTLNPLMSGLFKDEISGVGGAQGLTEFMDSQGPILVLEVWLEGSMLCLYVHLRTQRV